MAICLAVNLSLERGNSDGSCYHYVSLGYIAGPRFGDYAAGFRFGRLGCQLVEERELKRFQARTHKRLRGPRHTVDETCQNRPRHLAASA